MKVITQLIQHFWQRGALSMPEIEYLLNHDFVRAHDLPGYTPREVTIADVMHPGDTSVSLEPDEFDFVEEELVRRAPAARRGPRQASSDELSEEDVCQKLRAEYERRRVDLRSVHALGERFAEVADWKQAASELRDVSAERLYEGLCDELREGDVLLGDLWQASDPEPFHELLDDDETAGRAARAFSALLVATGPDALGKYGWILKYDDMQALVNLRVLNRRLLKCLHRLYWDDRLLLTHAMARNSDPVKFWTLVILYNAHRDPHLGEEPRYGVEYGPVKEPKSQEVWERAWTSALIMDREHVLKFLIVCYGKVAYYDKP
ncbi:MAG: hypothetical protein MI757_02295, partial [Pirellulales bacterium]|nr:hypothetical protein [Pirellulales bacterium]